MSDLIEQLHGLVDQVGACDGCIVSTATPGGNGLWTVCPVAGSTVL